MFFKKHVSRLEEFRVRLKSILESGPGSYQSAVEYLIDLAFLVGNIDSTFTPDHAERQALDEVRDQAMSEIERFRKLVRSEYD